MVYLKPNVNQNYKDFTFYDPVTVPYARECQLGKYSMHPPTRERDAIIWICRKMMSA